MIVGAKEERRRNQRRRLFRRDGWQDSRGDWFVMCAKGCGAVLSWEEAGRRKRDHTVAGRPDDNYELICKAGCNPRKADAVKRAWKRTQRVETMFATASRNRS